MIDRLAGLRKQMAVNGVEALFVTNPFNHRYLSGFTGTSGYLLISDQRAYLLTDFRYVEQAKAQAPLFEVVRHETQVLKTVAQILHDEGFKRIGFEDEDVTVRFYKQMNEWCQGVSWIPLSGTVEQLRAVKSEEEIRTIQKAAHIADLAFTYILGVLKPGVTEKEIALELEYQMRKNGAEKASFDIIVASGWRSALPHGVASDKVIENGEFVTLDFGAYYNGYCSDLTRTVAIGQVDETLKNIYQIVLDAQQYGIEQIKAGMEGKKADALVRQKIAAAGYGEYFGHGTGHSIGLEIHESPRLSPASADILQSGNIVTIEPGIYIPQLGGVRIEDDALIRENGCEILTHAEKQLIIL